MLGRLGGLYLAAMPTDLPARVASDPARFVTILAAAAGSLATAGAPGGGGGGENSNKPGGVGGDPSGEVCGHCRKV